MVIIANGEQIECARAVKGKDYIYLYDEFGNKIVSFEGISSFKNYEGEYEEDLPTEQDRIEALEMALLEVILGV